MVKIECVVTTAPRPVPRLLETLASLNGAGWEPLVVGEPGSPVPVNVDTSINETKLFAWPNHRHALALGLERWPDADAILVSQDDVSYARKCRPWLELNWPSSFTNLGVVSLYCPTHHTPDFEGWFCFPQNRLHLVGLGGVAFCYPRPAAERLIANPPAPRDRLKVDIHVAFWCHREELEFWLPYPSLCQHIGEHSTVHGNLGLIPERRAETWYTDMEAKTTCSTNPTRRR